MATVICEKHTAKFGWVKIEEGPGSWWTLYVNGDIKAQSADHGYIKKQYDDYN